jgi:CysZ protein
MYSIPDSYEPLKAANGITAFLGGTVFVLTTPRVWPLAAVPVIVLSLLGGVLTALGIWGAIELSTSLVPAPRAGWVQFGYVTLAVALSLLAVLLAALASLGLTQPLSGPALERISIAQQRQLTTTEPPSQGLLKSIWISVRAMLFALIGGGLALVVRFSVSLMFPPAAVVTVPMKFLVAAWMLAWDLLDYPLGLRGLGIRDRLRWMRRNLSATMVFGSVSALVSMVPGAILLLLPVGVAGATRLVLKDEPPVRPR